MRLIYSSSFMQFAPQHSVMLPHAKQPKRESPFSGSSDDRAAWYTKENCSGIVQIEAVYTSPLSGSLN